MLKRNILKSNYLILTRTEKIIGLVVIAGVIIGATGLFAGGGFLSALFSAVAPLLYLVLPGYWVLSYSSRNLKGANPAWVYKITMLVGLGLITFGILAIALYLIRPLFWLFVLGAVVYFLYSWGKTPSASVLKS
ncbi:MAG: hypothetical protein AAGD96_34470 [Chloroflexota bacterium]